MQLKESGGVDGKNVRVDPELDLFTQDPDLRGRMC